MQPEARDWLPPELGGGAQRFYTGPPGGEVAGALGHVARAVAGEQPFADLGEEAGAGVWKQEYQ